MSAHESTDGQSELRVFGAASASLASLVLQTHDLTHIERASVLVFSSPFAIDSAAPQVRALISNKSVKPILAVIGPGSARALQKYPDMSEQCRIVYPAQAPFDAQQLAANLKQVIAQNAEAASNSSKPHVTVLQGNRSATSQEQWQEWLGANCEISSVQVYRSEAVDQTTVVGAVIGDLKKIAIDDCVVYFTSASSVKPFAVAWNSLTNETNTEWGQQLSKMSLPRAVCIHPKIEAAVQRYLQWPSEVIEPGYLALLNYIK